MKIEFNQRKTRTQVWLILSLIISVNLCQAQSLIIDRHDVSLFDSIPVEYKEAASDLGMLFMDRSVGFNISTYLDCLSTPWSSALSSCKRYQHQDTLYEVDPAEVYWNGTWDRSNWRYAFWPTNCSEDVTCFLEYMDERLDSFDVFGCQFSYLAVLPGSNIADTFTGFFGSQGNENKATTYATYAAAHPDKKLIWWTTSLARGIGTVESESFNDQMREYAATHDIILFDVADILSHDPAGNICYDNRDGVTYKDESHPDDSLNIPAICPQYTTETDGGHLGAISAGGIRVSKAFWVLMAHLAGWNAEITSIETVKNFRTLLFPNPANGSLNVTIEDTGIENNITVLLFDSIGKLAGKHNFNVGVKNISTTYTIPLAGYTPGLYMVQVRIQNSYEIHKLVVY